MEALGGRGGQLQFRGEGASAPSSSTSCGPVGHVRACDERSVSRHRVREGGRVRTRRSNSATRSAPMARALRARAPAASLIAASRGPRSAVRVGLGLVGVRVGVGFGGSGLRHHFTTGRKSRRRRRTALPAGTGTKDTTAPSAESHAESAREADASGEGPADGSLCPSRCVGGPCHSELPYQATSRRSRRRAFILGAKQNPRTCVQCTAL